MYEERDARRQCRASPFLLSFDRMRILFDFIGNQTVCAILALVNNVHFSAFILEYEERMVKQIHLQDRFLGSHRLDGEALFVDLKIAFLKLCDV